LGELIDGLVALIENPEITDIQLMQYIPGPDFPTGSQILGTTAIKEAYTTGRGSITMRGVANIETIEQRGRPDRDAIIITELPYQTNKAALIEKIAEMVNEKRLEGIAIFGMKAIAMGCELLSSSSAMLIPVSSSTTSTSKHPCKPTLGRICWR
jgi:DNA gyrase/topoisomerase IV subunit A